MRWRRMVFWYALISLGLCWGIAHYVNPTDLEAKLFLVVGLAFLCLIVLLPLAFYTLPQDRPLLAAISLPGMLSPLIVMLSRPSLYINPFSILWSESQELITPWLVNSLLNSAIFAIAGYLIAGSSSQQRSITWPRSFLYAITIACLYSGIVYLGSLLAIPG